MKRKPGDNDRWIADVLGPAIGSKRSKELRELARQKDRGQDKRRRAQAQQLREKRAITQTGD